jgi:hypothetical protein
MLLVSELSLLRPFTLSWLSRRTSISFRPHNSLFLCERQTVTPHFWKYTPHNLSRCSIATVFSQVFIGRARNWVFFRPQKKCTLGGKQSRSDCSIRRAWKSNMIRLCVAAESNSEKHFGCGRNTYDGINKTRGRTRTGASVCCDRKKSCVCILLLWFESRRLCKLFSKSRAA